MSTDRRRPARRAIVAACFAAFAADASAQAIQQCFPRADFVANVASRGYIRAWHGLSGQVIYETWANPQTGEWGVVATMPNGISCAQFEGVAFSTAPDAATKPKEF